MRVFQRPQVFVRQKKRLLYYLKSRPAPCDRVSILVVVSNCSNQFDHTGTANINSNFEEEKYPPKK